MSLFIYYSKRKMGRHGFLILADKDLSQASEGQRFRVKEIHFRTSRPLPIAALELLRFKEKPTENKPLRLTIENRMREPARFELILIRNGTAADINEKWSSIIKAARKIDKNPNFTDGYKQNCLTLLFDALEEVGLPSPRDQYEQEVEAHKGNKDMVPIHPPFLGPR